MSKSITDKFLGGDPNLEGVWQFTKAQRGWLVCIINYEMKKAMAIQATLQWGFYKGIKHSNSHCL